jgi:hypothetical protein
MITIIRDDGNHRTNVFAGRFASRHLKTASRQVRCHHRRPRISKEKLPMRRKYFKIPVQQHWSYEATVSAVRSDWGTESNTLSNLLFLPGRTGGISTVSDFLLEINNIFSLEKAKHASTKRYILTCGCLT